MAARIHRPLKMTPVLLSGRAPHIDKAAIAGNKKWSWAPEGA
jgi:hypothetical protein